MGHISIVEVRYAETDQMGIAHHSNYAVWFEVARTDFIKAAGISYTDVEKEGIITPLTSLECKYKKAAFYEDQLQIHASLTKLSPVRLEFSYKVTRGGDLIATGKTTHGMVTKDLKPINVKKNIRKFTECSKMLWIKDNLTAQLELTALVDVEMSFY